MDGKKPASDEQRMKPQPIRTKASANPADEGLPKRSTVIGPEDEMQLAIAFTVARSFDEFISLI